MPLLATIAFAPPMLKDNDFFASLLRRNLGFDPYVTNTRAHGHPMYPVAGAGAVDFLSIQLSPGFHQHSRPVRLAVGLLARASNDNRAPDLKLPFTFDRRELQALPEADLRLGGFGPLRLLTHG